MEYLCFGHITGPPRGAKVPVAMAELVDNGTKTLGDHLGHGVGGAKGNS